MLDNAHYVAALAGAGTGKTYSLVENYLCALFGFDGTSTKKRPQEILALTFTQKAANEMRLRIAKRLSQLQRAHDPSDPLVVLAKEYGSLPSNEELRRISRALANAPIATFHGFCSSLLKKEACALGIDEGFDLLSPRDETLIARNVLRPLIVAELAHQSPIRSMVARFRLGNGTMSLGLIDGMWELYCDLVEQGVPCHALEQLTSRKPISKAVLLGATQEVSGALDYFFTTKTTAPTKERLGGIKRALEQFLLVLDHDHEPSIADRYSALRATMKGNFGDKDARAVLTATTIKLGAILVDYFVAHDEQAVARVLNQFHSEFVHIKNENRMLSYGDLLTKTKEALMHNGVLRRRLKQLYSHVLIDEYQDTSPIQEDIVSLLVESKLSERTIESSPVINAVDFAKGATMFVVGDKKQSIYGFRGADARLFDRMVNKMASSDLSGQTFRKRLLTINRRSRKRIIDLVNVVAAHTLSTQGYLPEHALVPLPELDGGSCALWIAGDNADDKTEQNLRGTAFGIADLLASRPNLALSDIVVLVRRIRSARTIKEHLATLSINARIVGGDGFFQQQEIVDLLCALKLAVNPGHEFASAIVLRSPLILISDQELLQSCTDASVITFLAAWERAQSGGLSAGSVERIQRFAEILSAMTPLIAENNLAACIDMLLTQTEGAYANGLVHNPHQAWANIEKLRVMLAKNTRNPYTAIDDFFDRIVEDRKEPLAEGKNSADAITLMTIHQSKGLEFKVVILADGESPLPVNHGDFLANGELGIVMRPRNRSIAACAPDAAERVHAQTRYDRIRDDRMEREKEELARLLYVALTRARDELYVVVSKRSFEKPQASTLVGLLLKALDIHGSPSAICDLITLSSAPRCLRDHTVTTDDAEPNLFVHDTYEKRIFASNLSVSDPTLFSSFIARDVQKNGFRIDGNLAHKLIAAVGAETAYQGHLDNADSLLSAAFRAGGFTQELYTDQTMRAVKITLTHLLPHVQNAAIMFEKPLFCWPNQALMIEGFADLVVEHDQHIAVIEFKSSVHAVQNPQTFFQVLAYAHALAQLSNKPIKFAVVGIGFKNEIVMHEYGAAARGVFLRSVAALEYVSPLARGI